MKIAVAALKQETNTFSPMITTLDDFVRAYMYFEDDVINYLKSTATEVGGFLHVLEREGADVIPIAAANGMAGGRVRRKDFETLTHEIVDRLKMVTNLDGLLVSLHGALAAEGIDDGEGYLLNKIRENLSKNVYIGCSLDSHANVTNTMLASADLLVGYKTYPHRDAFETGVQTADILCDCIQGNKQIHHWSVSLPLIIVPSESCQTTMGPMKQVMDRLKELEKEPGIISSSCFFPHPWLDIEDFNLRLVAYTEKKDATVEQRLNDIADLLLSLKDKFSAEVVPISRAICDIKNIKGRPVVWIDSGDIVLAGSPGDSTEVLEALYACQQEIKSVMSITDPAAVAKLKEEKAGEKIRLALGGGISASYHSPVTIRGQIKRVSNEGYRYSGPHMKGVEVHTGIRVVIQTRNLLLVVTENPDGAHDPEFYRSVGIPLEKMDVIVVKSHNTFKPAYKEISETYVRLKTRGVTTPDLDSLRFERIPRPLLPLDQDTESQNSEIL